MLERFELARIARRGEERTLLDLPAGQAPIREAWRSRQMDKPQEPVEDLQRRIFKTVNYDPKNLQELLSSIQKISHLHNEWNETNEIPGFETVFRGTVIGTHWEAFDTLQEISKITDKQLEANPAGSLGGFRVEGQESYIIPSEQAADALELSDLEFFLGIQKVIPELQLPDVYPTDKLTLRQVELYRDLQIFRKKFKGNRREAIKRLAQRIPLADPKANKILTKIIAHFEWDWLPRLKNRPDYKDNLAIKQANPEWGADLTITCDGNYGSIVLKYSDVEIENDKLELQSIDKSSFADSSRKIDTTAIKGSKRRLYSEILLQLAKRHGELSVDALRERTRGRLEISEQNERQIRKPLEKIQALKAQSLSATSY